MSKYVKIIFVFGLGKISLLVINAIFNNIVERCFDGKLFIGGGNQTSLEKLPTFCNALTKYHIKLY
jgi:hypothetical protein